MPLTVVVGGQFGSEGKGKVAHYLASEMGVRIAVRVGGSNSGHTVVGPDAKPWIFRHLPTAALLDDVTCVLPAGCYIDVDVLMREVFRVGLPENRLIIDPNAMVVTSKEIDNERRSSLRQTIGSTLSGTGAAVVKRIKRNIEVRLAGHDDRLRQFVSPAIPFMRENLDRGKRIIIEGTQGFGLSVLHSPYYPFATSRDTTAAGFVSEAGLSPLDVDDIVLVIRAFPIRVGGNSGPMKHEIDWATVTVNSGSQSPIVELTSVSRTVRRVGRFDPGVVKSAILANQPTRLVLNHLDYVDHECAEKGVLTSKAVEFITHVESSVGRQIRYFGIGPESLKTMRSRKHRALVGS